METVYLVFKNLKSAWSVLYSVQIYFMEHQPVHHVKHHPDLRWVIAMTVLVVGAGILVFYNIFGLSKPVPQAVLQVEQQKLYLEQANQTIIQLQKINNEMQIEIKSQDTMIDSLRRQIQILSTTTKN